jgi:hypothetical protein
MSRLERVPLRGDPSLTTNRRDPMLAGSARIDAGAGGIGLSPEQARGSVVDTPTDISRKKPLAIAAAHSTGDGSSGLASGLMGGLGL